MGQGGSRVAPPEDGPAVAVQQREGTLPVGVEADVFRVDAAVYENRVQTMLGRSLVQENASLIAKNHSTAFTGNRLLITQNTDDLFRNRLALLASVEAAATSNVKRAYAAAVAQKERIAYLKQRTSLNDELLSMTMQQAKSNAQAIEVNKGVMATDADIVSFNKKYIIENTNLLKIKKKSISEGLSVDQATPEAVAEMVKDNKSKVQSIEQRAQANNGQLSTFVLEMEGVRESIATNGAILTKRRVAIHANREQIRTNQQAVKEKIAEGGAAWIAMLSAKPPGSADPADEAALILDDTWTSLASTRADLFALEGDVLSNYVSAFEARSLVQENAALIQKNYISVFLGNRQLTNQNTEDLYRNRLAILRTLVADAKNETQRSYAEAMTQKENLSFMEHRAMLNEQVLDITKSMAVVNQQAMEINSSVIKANETIIEFNKRYIEENTQWLNGGFSTDSATPEAVADLVASNAKAVAELASISFVDRAKVEEAMAAARTNHESIVTDMDAIYKEAKKIGENRAQIQQNQQNAATKLAELA